MAPVPKMAVFKVGDATITRVEEVYVPNYPLRDIFPDFTDAHLAQHVLHRLFPAAPRGARSWPTLRWSTGRCALDADHPRLQEWRWRSAPPDGRPV